MLKALMLKRSIDAKRRELAELEGKDAGFVTREAELETAINEVEPGNAEQEEAINAEIEAFETEKDEHDAAKETLRDDIEALETELEELERSAPTPPAPATPKAANDEKRGVNAMQTINIRSLPMNQRALEALPMDRRDAILGSEDVKGFLERVRAMKGQTRAISGADLTIPGFVLELVAENMFRYSKLLNRVRVRNVSGEARQTIAGHIPEAVWTEMCGAINELSFGFSQISVDGYKVAGYIPVCNSLLEDSDVNLASWIVEMISEAIGLAMDKAILYGKGSASKMPLGIVTRLAQTGKPSDYPASAPEWVDLHTTNVIQIDGTGSTGAGFWAKLVEATGATRTNYSRGEQFWAMNSNTYAKLRSKLITFTATGDIVANLFGTLPVVNGNIDILEFMPDGDIVGGYGDLYLLVMRAAMQLSASEHVQFLQDNTVYKGTMRADGQPIIPGAFVAINIENKSVTTAMDFAADDANDAKLSELTIDGVTLSPTFDADKMTYTGGTASKNDSVIQATPVQGDAKVTISLNGKNVVNGGKVKFTQSVKNTVDVTVTMGNAVRVYTVTFTGAGA